MKLAMGGIHFIVKLDLAFDEIILKIIDCFCNHACVRITDIVLLTCLLQLHGLIVTAMYHQ